MKATKKAISLILSALLLIPSLAVVPVTAKTATAPQYYEWNFEDSALNDLTNGVFTANTGNNTLTVKTPTDTSTVAGKISFKQNTTTAGYSVKKATVSSLGNALYAVDRYLDFGTDVHLAANTPWKVELTGILIGGDRRGVSNVGNGLGTAAMLANDQTNDYLFINGDQTPFYFEDNDTQYQVVNTNSTNWPSNGRLAQNRVQKLTLWNEYNSTDGKWHIHWTVANQNSADAWDNVDCYTNGSYTGRDFVFSGIGSNDHYLTAARQYDGGLGGYKAIEGYLSSIKIWEDTSYTPVNYTASADYYEWNFEDASLNNQAAGIYKANTGNNTIKVQTPENLTMTQNAFSGLTNDVTGGATVEAASVASLGKALYVADWYLEFDKDIHLAKNTAWKVELTGILVAGNSNGTASNGRGTSAILANDETDDYLYINGDTGNAFVFTDNASNYAVQASNSTYSSSARIGQNRVQKLTIWNEKGTDGNWYVHWTLQNQSSAEAWDKVDYHTNGNYNNRDFVFSGLGSEEHYLTASRQWAGNAFKAIRGYFSSIKIWEDTAPMAVEGAQVLSGTTQASTETDVRLIGSVNSLQDFSKVGFVISKTATAPVIGSASALSYETSTVYTSINAGGTVCEAKDGTYYFAMAIEEIPQANFGTTLYARPYAVRQDGTVLYGDTVSFTVNQLL